jgi:transcriptional regulator with XRE-family HTH domain
MSNKVPDSTMIRAREAFKASGMTLDELGLRMGHAAEVARQSAWQFLSKTADPRVSMLRRFAVAVGIPIADLFAEPPEKKKGRSK